MTFRLLESRAEGHDLERWRVANLKKKQVSSH